MRIKDSFFKYYSGGVCVENNIFAAFQQIISAEAFPFILQGYTNTGCPGKKTHGWPGPFNNNLEK